MFRKRPQSPLGHFASFVPVQNSSAWLWLLLLASGDIESNPGPIDNPGNFTAESALSASGENAKTTPNFDEVKECVFFGYGGEECALLSTKRGTSQSTWTTSLLRSMTMVEDIDLHLPQGYSERDLIYNRLTCGHPDVPINYDTQLCPWHRFHLGIGVWKTTKEENKGANLRRVNGKITKPWRIASSHTNGLGN